MACNLTTGRSVPCKDSVGGIQAVYFADFGTMGTLTVTAGEVRESVLNPALEVLQSILPLLFGAFTQQYVHSARATMLRLRRVKSLNGLEFSQPLIHVALQHRRFVSIGL